MQIVSRMHTVTSAVDTRPYFSCIHQSIHFVAKNRLGDKANLTHPSPTMYTLYNATLRYNSTLHLLRYNRARFVLPHEYNPMSTVTSWVGLDFRYLGREVGIHFSTQTCTYLCVII